MTAESTRTPAGGTASSTPGTGTVSSTRRGAAATADSTRRGIRTVWSERVVVRDGVRLSCRDRGGSGPAMVLLHGLAGHAGEWDAVAERLHADGHRVVAVD